MTTRWTSSSLLVLFCIGSFGCGDSGPGGSSVPGVGGATVDPSNGGASASGLAGAAPLGGRTPSGGTTGEGGTRSAGGSSMTSAGGSSMTSAGGSSTTSNGGSATGGTGGTGVTSSDPSAEIYDPDKLVRFDIDLPQASISTLNLVTGPSDPRQETYVTATLKYGSETVPNIGIRLKGEGSFQKLDKKPAFKLKFDEFVSGQRFRGLARLTLNNLFEDPSFVAERLAYDVFRAAGLPAPRCNNALVYVNGTFYGVYANVEAEDKAFLRRWFADDEGNLYEEGQKDFVTGAETAFNLETNESVNDRTDLKNLIASIQGATDPVTFLQDVGTYLNTEQFLKFTAAEAAVNQWDMYAYTVFYVNNMRIYSDPVTGKFWFIPWGMDMSMKPFRDSGKPYISLFTLARQGDNPSGKVTAGLVFQKCLQSPLCKTAYKQAVEQVISVYEGLALEARATTYYNQIKAQVVADTRKNVCCDGRDLTNAEFETGFQSVVTTIRGRVAKLRADLAAN